MISRKSVLISTVAGIVLGLSGCNDDNTSTLAAFSMPGDMHVVAHCMIDDHFVVMDDAGCTAAGGTMVRNLYVANMGSASLSFIPFYPKGAEFEVVDITTSVPGVTSIPTGERPHSIAGDALGAFVVLVSAVGNDISIVSTNDNREIAWQKLDKKPRKILFHASDDAFYVFFSDGSVRRLVLTFDCGNEQGILPASCSLDKDKITITWTETTTLDGTVSDVIDDPVLNRAFVSYSDRRYISILAYDDTQGSCANGSTSYPCEVRRMGAGFGCADGLDNDGDGLIDAQDPKCFYPWSIESPQSTEDDIQVGWFGIGECGDGIDNDGDGLIDALDPGCVSSNDASEAEGFQPMTPGTCADGIDNNGDGDADRDDMHCRWPSDDESDDTNAITSGLCRDGLDNDGDGLIDTDDSACYGKNGYSESDLASHGRGALGIDPRGRWLYVLDPVDSQLIVIDLSTEKTLDRSGWYPRHRLVGIPVSRLVLAVAGDIRQDDIYQKNDHIVSSERAVVFVTSTSGSVSEYLIHQKLTHTLNNVVQNSVEELALRATDTDDDASYVGIVRCMGRICTDSDLPQISLRRRPAISFFAQPGILSDTDPATGKRHSVVYDSIIASETWRITYEGTLEHEERSDGYFDKHGVFHATMDMCLLGARPGDRLVLRSSRGLRDLPQCAPFRNTALEWTVTGVGPHSVHVAPTGNNTDAPIPPSDECFTPGLDYELRASQQWIVTSKSTYVNRRITAGDTCIDDFRHPYGQTRFTFDAPGNADTDVQTAFFGIKMPPNAATLKTRDMAFEFTTRTGNNPLTLGVAAAPTAIRRFITPTSHFMLISEASANAVIVYDVDDESIDDTL